MPDLAQAENNSIKYICVLRNPSKKGVFLFVSFKKIGICDNCFCSYGIKPIFTFHKAVTRRRSKLVQTLN